MKAWIGFGLTLMTFVGSGAFAQTGGSRRPITNVQTVNFDGKILKLGYQVGGGCAKHEGVIDVTLDEATGTVKTELFDVTEKFDGCEALLFREATIDLRSKVLELMAEKKLAAGSVHIELPQTQMLTF